MTYVGIMIMNHDQGEGEEEAGNGVTCDVGPVAISSLLCNNMWYMWIPVT